MKKFIFYIAIIFTSNSMYAQKITPQEYIETYKNAAIAEMQRTGIPASVTLAQGLLETESGNSDLVKRSNNHFGIKCKSIWTGESVRHTDDAPNECFRKYQNAADSYKDHSDYLKTSPRYASLFELQKNDYKGWAFGLKKAGYATNPRYPQIVIGNIEKYNLQQFDEGYIIPVGINNSSAMYAVNTTIPILTTTPNPVDVQNAIKAATKFNGLKAYFASKGTSILAIATAANIDLVKILEYNDLQSDGILQDDQMIYLERKLKQAKAPEYTSIQGETMYDIAQNFGVQLKQLLIVNNMQSNQTLPSGVKIKLR